MKFYKACSFLTLLACLSLSSCYHQFAGGGGGGNNNGTAFVNIFVTSTPSSTFSFPSLNWPVDNVFIIDGKGNTISLGGTSGVAFPDFARLQTDSTYVGHATLAATNYTNLKVELGAPLASYFYNNTNATLLGCAVGTVCLIPNTVAGLGSATITIPITYAATGNTSTGIRINFDLSKAVTNAGGMTFDFTQNGAITLTALPVASSQSAGIDFVDNFTGSVFATTATSVTLKSFVSENRTFTMAANAVFDDPFGHCPVPASFSCIVPNQNLSIDGYVNTPDGSFVATEVEFLDPAPATNELEGLIVKPVTNSSFQIILSNGMGSQVELVSTPVNVTLNGAETYAVDPKNLADSGGTLSTTPVGFLSQADLVLGQTVMLQGGTINANNGTLTNPTRVLLRYSSVGGTIQSIGNPALTLSGVDPFFQNLLNNSGQVQTFPNTAYDGVTSFGGLTTNTNISVRALYLNPTAGEPQALLAAKIRSH
jgi:uncharacterized protein DUF5666